MSKWNKKFAKLLSAAAVSFLVTANAMAVPIGAFAATSTADEVRIRNEATTEGDNVIGSLSEGEEVTILDIVEADDGYTWYYVQLENGNTGYVRADFIDASEEELSQFGQGEPEAGESQEEQQVEDAGNEEKSDDGEDAQTEADSDQPKTEENTEAASPAATDQQAADEPADYDATKDPNAHFSVKFETEDDGSGSWYVYNDDNGSRIRISDMSEGEKDSKAAGGPGLWKPAAIIFGLLTLGLAAFALYLIKSIRDGRKSSRRRNLEVAGYSPYEEDDDDSDEEDDEYYFDDDDETEEKVIRDSTVEMDEPEDSLPEAEEPGEEIAEDFREVVETEEEELPLPEEPQEQSADPESVGAEEETELPDEEDFVIVPEPAAQAEKTASYNEPEAESGSEAEPDVNDAAEEDSYIEEDEIEEDDYIEEDDEFDDDEESDGDDGFEDDGSEDEEEYDDEEYFEEDDDFEDDDDSEDLPAGKSSSGRDKGSFFGFLRKIFGSESREDADEDADFDDEEEENVREFDEFKEYPEDIEYLPKDEEDFEDDDDLDEDGSMEYDREKDTGRGRLSMQRVMKNVGYKEEENDFSDKDFDDDDLDDLTDSLIDDDDDMSYSFIGNSRKK